MSRRTTTQLSSVTVSLVDSGLVNGPTASVSLDSNIYLDTTGSTIQGVRRPIYIPAPRVTAKFSPPLSYEAYQDWISFFQTGGLGVGKTFPAGTTAYGSTASKIFNAPPTVYLSWMGASGGYSDQFLNYSPTYLLYYYSSSRGPEGPGVTNPKGNPRRKWRHPLSYSQLNATIDGSLSGFNRAYPNSPSRLTEFAVPNDGSPLLISALNYGTGASYSWNDGFHPSQYLTFTQNMYTIVGSYSPFGVSHILPVGVTASIDDLFSSGLGVSVPVKWGTSKRSVYLKSYNQPYIGKQPSLFFKFRIRILHPDGQYMYGPFSETLVIKPRIGLFQGVNLPGPFYCFYGWNLKVR